MFLGLVAPLNGSQTAATVFVTVNAAVATRKALRTLWFAAKAASSEPATSAKTMSTTFGSSVADCVSTVAPLLPAPRAVAVNEMPDRAPFAWPAGIAQDTL